MGFNHVKVKEEDKYKTAFQTYNRYYQYYVILIGLINAPVTF